MIKDNENMQIEKQEYSNRDIMEAIIKLEYKLSASIKEVDTKLDNHIRSYDIIVLGKDTDNGLVRKTSTLATKIEALEDFKNNIAGRMMVIGVIISTTIAYLIKKI